MLHKVSYKVYEAALRQLDMKPDADYAMLDHFMFEGRNGVKMAVAVDDNYPPGSGAACAAWIDWINPKGEYDGDDSKREIAEEIADMLDAVKEEYGAKTAWTTINVPPYRLKELKRGEKLGWEYGMDEYAGWGWPIYSPRADGYVYFMHARDNVRLTAAEEIGERVEKWLSPGAKKSESYLDAWKKANPKLHDSGFLARQAFRRLHGIIDEIGAERLAEAAAEAAKHGYVIADKLVRQKFARFFKPGTWWNLIPAQTYKAMLSRQRDLRLRRRAYGVSEKTLRECLDKICENYCKLKFIYDFIIGNEDFECGEDLFAIPLYDKLLKRGVKAGDFINQLLETSLSYIPPENGKRFGECFTDTPYTFEAYKRVLDGLPAEPNADQMVVAINRCVDICHNRGALAWAFVEGGERTCAEASGMKPDEIYESADRQIRYWAHMLDETFCE